MQTLNAQEARTACSAAAGRQLFYSRPVVRSGSKSVRQVRAAAEVLPLIHNHEAAFDILHDRLKECMSQRLMSSVTVTCTFSFVCTCYMQALSSTAVLSLLATETC